MSDELTNKFFKSVYSMIKENHIKRIYLLPDFNLGDYSIAGSRLGDEFLIDLVDSIIHITNYNVFWRKPKRKKPDYLLNRIYGETDDIALQEIQSWLNSRCNENDNMKLIKDDKNSEYFIKDSKKALIIYGHGLQKESRSISRGALGIGAGSHTVYIEDILEEIDLHNLEYFVLMSCSGGMKQ
jgi:hypothetical protein